MHFFAKSPCQYGFGKRLFFVDLILTFCGVERSIFQSLWRFSKIEGRPSILENHLTVDWWSSSTTLPQIFLMNCITWFSKIEGRPSILENHCVAFTKMMGNMKGAPLNFGKPPHRGLLLGTLSPFWGGKTQKKLANFVLRLRDAYKKYILQKKLGQNGHSSPQQWSGQSTDAYVGLPPPTRWSI